MPQTTLLLLLLFPLLILILHSSSAIVANDPHYLDCSRPYRCSGTNINVSFPFRLPDSPSYCGVPGYDLYCSDFNSELSINLSGVNYRVKDISYTQGFITLVDSDFLDNLCPQTFTNTSINSTLFDFADFDFNLTVYINCTIPLPLPGLSEILCFADPIGLHSYYKLDKGSPSFLMDIGWCQLKAAVPVYERAAMSLNGSSAKFGEALQQGFGLKWNAGKGWCKGCIDSGGVCGYNSVNATDPTCFCPNNTAIGSCPYGRSECFLSFCSFSYFLQPFLCFFSA